MKRILLIALVVLACFRVAQAQDKSVNPGINRQFEKANVPEFLERFEKEGRDVFDRRNEVVAALGIKPGFVVADVGAGTGLFTRMFSPLVGPQGRVIAVDISQEFIRHVEGIARQQNITNISGVVCKPDSAELPADSVDLVFICDTYHHFEFPHKTMRSIYSALKPAGQVVLIDFHRIPGKSTDWAMNHVRAGQEVFAKEITDAGFRKVEEKQDLLKESYFLRFEKVIPKEPSLHTFQRTALTDVYFSEGANAGDMNRDGHMDIVYGPYWFAGPSFSERHEIYPPKPQNRDAYADNFFNWVYDFDSDGWNDVFVVGFPGTPAHVYQNPGNRGGGWKKHVVFDSVANESPHFIQLTGDNRPELVCCFDSKFGYATVNWDKPFEKWTFHPISEKAAPDRFGHGLGAGDVDGDGKLDILIANGWFQQPSDNPDTTRWMFHEAAFTNAYGGAEMHAYDVDGDGDNDIITSLAAHEYGLAWYEQDRSGSEIVFRQHLIMGNQPSQNRYGVLFTEPHSVALVDMDGDGLKDIVTGKTYWSHHKQSPMWDAGAVVYWFQLVRTEHGPDWIPHLADTEAGIGRQVSIADVNGDQLPDIVVGGMKGAHVLIHERKAATGSDYQKSLPKPLADWRFPLRRGPASVLDKETHRVANAIEAESIENISVTGGQTDVQSMEGFAKDHWSGDKQIFWGGAKTGDRMEFDVVVPETGTYNLQAAFTLARDYGMIRVHWDGQAMGQPIDLFNFPDVITSGVHALGTVRAESGKHRMAIEIVGANAAAVPKQMVGLDYIRLVPVVGAKP